MNEVINVPKLKVSINTLFYPAIVGLIAMVFYWLGFSSIAAIIVGILSVFVVVLIRIFIRRYKYEQWLIGLGKDADLSGERDSLSILGAVPFNNRACFINVTVCAQGIVIKSKSHQRFVDWDQVLSVKYVKFQSKDNLQITVSEKPPYNLINIPWDEKANKYIPTRSDYH